MVEASSQPSTAESGGERHADVVDDPSLETLLPASSWVRGAVAVGLLTILVVGAWLSPSVLRPNIGASGGPWSRTIFEDAGEVVTTMRLTPEGRDTTIVAVESLPGAQVVDAWVLDYAPDSRYDEFPVDPLEHLAERYPGQDLAASSLPQRVSESDGVRELVVLWRITDCVELQGSQQPVVELRTAIGTTVRQPVDEFLNPGSFHEWVEMGLCEDPRG